jgi:phosphatidylglycerophosphatase A
MGDRSMADRAAVAIATAFGVGRFPVAPGTFGSLPGLLVAWALWKAGGTWAVVVGAAVVAAVGSWAAGRAARLWGAEDPGAVVVDEVAGQMVALFFLPPSPAVLAAAFLLFRAMDILKPWPASKLERLPGGSGIMADDLAAGAIANLVLQLAIAFGPRWTTIWGAA